MNYNFNLSKSGVNRSRGFSVEQEIVPQQITPPGIRDFFLHALFARFAFKDNHTEEFKTNFNENSNRIELDIPDKYLSFIEQVGKDANFERFISWLMFGCVSVRIYPPSDADPLVGNTGDMYYNTALKEMMVYDEEVGGWASIVLSNVIIKL